MPKLRKSRFLTTLALTSIALLGSAHARSINEIKTDGTLVVGISNNVPPFQMKVGELNVGFEVEMVRALANGMGLNVKFKEIPSIPGLMAALAADDVDAIVSTLAVTSTREKGGDFTNPYACLGASIFTSDPKVKTASDLQGKTLGMVTGTAFLSYLQKQNVTRNVIEYPTAEIMVMSMMQKKHEGTIAWKAMIPYMNKVYKLNLQDTPTLWSIPVGMLVRENNAGLRLAVNTAILRTQQDGTFDALDKKYFAKDSVKCKK